MNKTTVKKEYIHTCKFCKEVLNLEISSPSLAGLEEGGVGAQDPLDISPNDILSDFPLMLFPINLVKYVLHLKPPLRERFTIDRMYIAGIL